MCNSGVQVKVLAAPSEDTLRSAIEIKYELKLRERALGYTVKPQPQNPCTRCGQEFQPNHLRKCWAKNQKCTNCGKMGHFGRMCKRPRRFWALWTFSNWNNLVVQFVLHIVVVVITIFIVNVIVRIVIVIVVLAVQFVIHNFICELKTNI